MNFRKFLPIFFMAMAVIGSVFAMDGKYYIEEKKVALSNKSIINIEIEARLFANAIYDVLNGFSREDFPKIDSLELSRMHDYLRRHEGELKSVWQNVFMTYLSARPERFAVICADNRVGRANRDVACDQLKKLLGRTLRSNDRHNVGLNAVLISQEPRLENFLAQAIRERLDALVSGPAESYKSALSRCNRIVAQAGTVSLRAFNNIFYYIIIVAIFYYSLRYLIPGITTAVGFSDNKGSVFVGMAAIVPLTILILISNKLDESLNKREKSYK